MHFFFCQSSDFPGCLDIRLLDKNQIVTQPEVISQLRFLKCMLSKKIKIILKNLKKRKATKLSFLFVTHVK